MNRLEVIDIAQPINYCGSGQNNSNGDSKRLFDSGCSLKVELKHSALED